MVDIAEAVCRGVCKHFGRKYIPVDSAAETEEKPVETNTIYRVQVGAFHNRKYAEALRDELKENGYDAFIV